MEVIFIANVMENKSRIGIRVAILESIEENKQAAYKDITESSFMRALFTRQVECRNLGVDGSVLKGTNGALDRYSSIENNKIQDKLGIVIINRIVREEKPEETIGFRVMDPMGRVIVISCKKLISMCESDNVGIANGKVVTIDDGEHISSIAGEYNIERYKRRYTGRGNNKVAGSVKINNDINAKLSLDIFQGLTEEQKWVIRRFYMEYTRRQYSKMSSSVRLNIAESKVENLAQIRGEEEWRYAGIIDFGVTGGAHCTLGHALRYAHYAIAGGEKLEIRDIIEGNEDRAVIFGETCASDFFDISIKDMKELIKIRKQMSKDIEVIIETALNGTDKDVTEGFKEFYRAMDIIGRGKDINFFWRSAWEFRDVNLRLPSAIVINACNFISKLDRVKVTKKFLGKNLYNHVDNLYGNNRNNKEERVTIKLIDYYFTNLLNGYYRYNPLSNKSFKRADVGGYNKDCRAARRGMLRDFRNAGFALDSTHTLDAVSNKLLILENSYRVGEIIDSMVEQGGGVRSIDDIQMMVDKFGMMRPYGTEWEKGGEYTFVSAIMYLIRSNEQLRKSVRYFPYVEIDRNQTATDKDVLEVLKNGGGIDGENMQRAIETLLDKVKERREEISNKKSRVEKDRVDRLLPITEGDVQREVLKIVKEAEEYGVEVKYSYSVGKALDIIEHGIAYIDLSTLQKKRVDGVLKKLQELKDNKFTGFIPDRGAELDSILEEKVRRLEDLRGPERDEIDKKHRIVYMVIKSIRKRPICSIKQIGVIERAYKDLEKEK